MTARYMGRQLAPQKAYSEPVLQRRGLSLRTEGRRHRGSKTSLERANKRASSAAAHLAKIQGESPGRHRGACAGRRWEVGGGEGRIERFDGNREQSRTRFGPKKLKFWLV